MTDLLKFCRKAKPRRDKQYLKRVLILWPFCPGCGKPSTDAHHTTGGFHGMKTSDYSTIGTCRECNLLAETDKEKREELFEAWVKWVLMGYLNGDIRIAE